LHGHGVSKKLQKIITQCTSKGPAILASPWQVAYHKIIKTLQNFICKHTRDLGKCSKVLGRKKGEFKGHQASIN
jgi:hypothetical protein